MSDVAPGRREQTKAANRAAILVAARAVFGEVGFGAASVRDIIRRTDLAAGTFYNYFPDKASIFRALVDDIALGARVRVREARHAATDREGFIRDGYRAFFAYVTEDPANHAFLARNAGTIRAFSEDGQVPLGVQDLAEDLQAAIDEGRLEPLDVDYAANVMLALGLELALRLIDREPPDVDGATAFATDFVLGGLERVSG
jgi:AcrR family transcriptional regulator